MDGTKENGTNPADHISSSSATMSLLPGVRSGFCNHVQTSASCRSFEPCMLKLGLCTLRCGPWSHLSANFTLHWRCYGRSCKNPANSNHVLGGYPSQTVDKVITDSLTLLESGKIIIVPCGGICSGRPHHLLVIKIMINRLILRIWRKK